MCNSWHEIKKYLSLFFISMSGISPQCNTRKDSCIILSDRECSVLGSGIKQTIFPSSLKYRRSAENVFVRRPLTRQKRRVLVINAVGFSN